MVSLADRDGLREDDVDRVVVPSLFQAQTFIFSPSRSRAGSTYGDLGVWTGLAAKYGGPIRPIPGTTL